MNERGRLPSLSALRAFEAAGRHLSFTRAGQELHVSQAAISHQIRALEEDLGVALFHRTTRRLELTQAGERLLPAASSAFETLAQAVEDLRRGDRVLAVTTTPSFGAQWLAPRLGRFAARFPDIELTVRHTLQSLDLRRNGLDAGIRWGRGDWQDYRVELLMPAELVPVAAPGYVAAHQLKVPEDLTRVTLLHDTSYEDWMEWLQVAGKDPMIARRGVILDDENALVTAALDGQGVALILQPLIQLDLRDGRLVVPFDLPFAEGYGFYLVYPPESEATPRFRALRQFLTDEIAPPKGETKG